MKRPDLNSRISEFNEIELGSNDCVVIDKVYGPYAYPRVRISTDPHVPGWRFEIELDDGTWDPIHVETII
jgi:hypothetical protein